MHKPFATEVLSTVETIAALATPPGRSALAVIRVSGPQAFTLLSTYWKSEHAVFPALRTQVLGTFCAEDRITPIDQVLACCFKAPASYTGEDLVEISCHGNPTIVTAILESLTRGGARLAEPGEFTKRAYLNGKMDLLQAEAVGQVIHAQSEKALQAAHRQVAGSLSSELTALRKDLLDLLSWMEADIDFGDREVDDVVPVDAINVHEKLRHLRGAVSDLLSCERRSRALRDGIRVVLAGCPNVGKSSLFNLFYGENRALVDSRPGTTRDFLEAWMQIGGVQCLLYDTAGLHEGASGLEAQGIARSAERLAQADLILAVLDASQPLRSEDIVFLDGLSAYEAPVLAVLNKIDLPLHLSDDILRRNCFGLGERLIGVTSVSAESRVGFSELLAQLADVVCDHSGADDGAPLLSVRQVTLLRTVDLHLQAGLRALTQGFGDVCATADLREAVNGFSKLLGRDIDGRDQTHLVEEMLDGVFATFCIGK